MKAKFGKTKELYCNKCKTVTDFQYVILYNFGDPNLGARDEYWKCVICDDKRDVSVLL
jgi:hypothetical protein